MRRRGATLLVGALVLVALIAASFGGITVPYVALVPGPTWNTLGTDHNKDVIQISGGSVSSSKGQLRMVTVGVEDQISLWDAIRGWLSSDDAVVPREAIYPPDQSQQQVDQANQQDFRNSQNSATVAALRELGYAVHVSVKDVPSGSPATGHLQAGDEITSVNGEAVTSGGKLTSLIRSKPVGTALAIGYTRAGQAGSTTVTTVKAQDGSPRIGVTIDQQQPSPYKITINLDNVGGPSAGLMFSLGILDKLEPQDLTGGLQIAGTGTIDDDGNVGLIGGIPQKMRAAKRDGATIFLVPSDNCAEAVANAVPGLELLNVGTLDQALDDLKTLRSGGAPARCQAH